MGGQVANQGQKKVLYQHHEKDDLMQLLILAVCVGMLSGCLSILTAPMLDADTQRECIEISNQIRKTAVCQSGWEFSGPLGACLEQNQVYKIAGKCQGAVPNTPKPIGGKP